MRTIVWVFLVGLPLGCGGSTKKPAECWDCGDPPMNDRSDEQAAHRTLCNLARSHVTAQCPSFATVDPSLVASDCPIVASFFMAGLESCVLETGCERVEACIAEKRANPGAYRGPTRSCNAATEADAVYPVGLTRAAVLASYGATDTTFADSPSSREKPIEVCGFPAAGEYLLRTTCKDGSKPLATRDAARAARVGNVGEGGQCKRIIDHYAVPCPEQTYDVFIDSYRCEQR